MMPRSFLLAAAVLLIAATGAAAQTETTARLTLTVLDQTSGSPVRDARVSIPEFRPTFTNGRGVARVDRIPAGNRIVVVTRLGYAPRRVAIEFPAGGEVEQTVRMESEAVAVRGVAVQEERRDPTLDRGGFYERQRRGFGDYMTSETIDRLRPSRTIDLFRRMRGFMVNFDRKGNPYLMTTRGGVGMAVMCAQPLVFVDGMLSTSRGVSASMALDMVPPDIIAGIEAYAGASSIPVEYNPTGAACGVVLIWTRH